MITFPSIVSNHILHNKSIVLYYTNFNKIKFVFSCEFSFYLAFHLKVIIS